MGNKYYIFCLDCKVFLFVGKKDFSEDIKKMYVLETFLIDHSNHTLKFGGTEWNRVEGVMLFDDGVCWHFPEEWIEYNEGDLIEEFNKVYGKK